MTIRDNVKFIDKIGSSFESLLPIELGVNKKNELVRLVFEICRANGLSPENVLDRIDINALVKDGKSELFHRVKNALVIMRYPSSGPDDNLHIMPVKITAAARECPAWDLKLEPKTIFIEKNVRDREWTQSFLGNFPRAKTVPIDDVKEALESFTGDDPVALYNARRDNIFLIENKAAFLKICPCTKDAKRCGYWILNLGFGCPVDCSYCYLQVYSNIPGIVLPANMEDYYDHIRDFDRKARRRIRIGTGEFTDSLAFDSYTKYSSYLMPFFRDMKKLVLELKTKVADIDDVLKEEPNENVVISWSVNTHLMAEKYEKGGAGMAERIDAAGRAARRGYKIGFHFDPVIYYNGWEDGYRSVVREIFSRDEIRDNTVWISLGTLRYTPGLKQVAEQRFDENLMYYQGEFFEDIDGKLRYPRRLRIEMYNKMIGWIREFVGSSCWIYLCMEPESVWKKTDLEKKDHSFR